LIVGHNYERSCGQAYLKLRLAPFRGEKRGVRSSSRAAKLGRLQIARASRFVKISYQNHFPVGEPDTSARPGNRHELVLALSLIAAFTQ
jgi:hypothetical protein